MKKVGFELKAVGVIAIKIAREKCKQADDYWHSLKADLPVFITAIFVRRNVLCHQLDDMV